MDGRDKSRLVVEGRVLIVRQLDALRPLTREIVIIANEVERFADLNVPVVPDALQGTGALGGLYTALISARADWIVVVACDMPFITAGAVARLASEAASSGGDGAWARSDRGVEPLFACYRTNAASRVKALIDSGDRRLSDVGTVLTMQDVEVSRLDDGDREGLLLTNLNTPEDYARVQ